MEGNKKKPILVAVVVLCLILAVGITVLTKKDTNYDITDIEDTAQMWVKCANTQCNAEYQMPKKQYFGTLRDEQRQPQCKDCGETSIFEAIKCPKCGVLFFRGAVRGDLPDRCPECSFSQMEENRKK